MSICACPPLPPLIPILALSVLLSRPVSMTLREPPVESVVARYGLIEGLGNIRSPRDEQGLVHRLFGPVVHVVFGSR